jgi:tetratricopeptide (TPR) repeat protein
VSLLSKIGQILSKPRDIWRTDPYELTWKVHAALSAGNFPAARDAATIALSRRSEFTDPGVVEFLLDAVGSSWLHTGDYAAGIAYFDECIRAYPNDAAAYRIRAALRWYNDQLDAAVQDYAQSDLLAPYNFNTLSGYGQALAEIGRSQEALSTLDAAIAAISSLPPSAVVSVGQFRRAIHAFALNGKGVALGATGDSVGALKAFEESIAMWPDNAWVYFNRAKFFEAGAETDKSLADYKAALTKADPTLTPSKRRFAQSRLAARGQSSR